MEYVFGTVRKNGVMTENVKTVGAVHSSLEGRVSVTRKYADSHITDSFTVLEKYRTEEGKDGTCYDWYAITGHYRYEDRFTPGIPLVKAEVEATQDALCEASGDFEDRIGEIEDALCELTEE